jgi:hypothetical protein
MALSLDLVLSYSDFIKPHELWRQLGIDRHIEDSAPLPARDLYLGKKVKVIGAYLESAKEQMSFALGFGHEHQPICPMMRFSHLTDWKFARLSIINLDELIENRAEWLENIFNHEGFIYARLYDTQYQHLQTMTSLQSFELAGIDHSQLPKKHNGFPYPIGEEIVDISKNPGRWEFRQGFEAAVGNEMWLGQRFFELTHLTSEQVENCEFKVNAQAGITHFLAYPTAFNSAIGLQGELQNKLWKLLYGNADN